MRRLLPILVLLAACDAMPRESRPDEDQMLASGEFSAPGAEAVWEIARLELGRSGWRLDSNGSDAAVGTFETHWVESLSPVRYDGKRRKIIGRVVPSEATPGSYRVLAVEWVQANADIKSPLESTTAIWQDEEPDTALVAPLLERIRGHFEAPYSLR